MLIFCLKRNSNVCQFDMMRELPVLGLYNNVCNDVTCAGMAALLLNGKSNGGLVMLKFSVGQ